MHLINEGMEKGESRERGRREGFHVTLFHARQAMWDELIFFSSIFSPHLSQCLLLGLVIQLLGEILLYQHGLGCAFSKVCHNCSVVFWES